MAPSPTAGSSTAHTAPVRRESPTSATATRRRCGRPGDGAIRGGPRFRPCEPLPSCSPSDGLGQSAAKKNVKKAQTGTNEITALARLERERATMRFSGHCRADNLPGAGKTLPGSDRRRRATDWERGSRREPHSSGDEEPTGSLSVIRVGRSIGSAATSDAVRRPRKPRRSSRSVPAQRQSGCQAAARAPASRSRLPRSRSRLPWYRRAVGGSRDCLSRFMRREPGRKSAHNEDRKVRSGAFRY